MRADRAEACMTTTALETGLLRPKMYAGVKSGPSPSQPVGLQESCPRELVCPVEGKHASFSGKMSQDSLYLSGPHLKSLLRSTAGIRGFGLFRSGRIKSTFSTSSYLF